MLCFQFDHNGLNNGIKLDPLGGSYLVMCPFKENDKLKCSHMVEFQNVDIIGIHRVAYVGESESVNHVRERVLTNVNNKTIAKIDTLGGSKEWEFKDYPHNAILLYINTKNLHLDNESRTNIVKQNNNNNKGSIEVLSDKQTYKVMADSKPRSEDWHEMLLVVTDGFKANITIHTLSTSRKEFIHYARNELTFGFMQ